VIYLILSILCSTIIITTFKMLERNKIPVFPVIVMNYVVASALGFIVARPYPSLNSILNSEWLIFASIIGFIFIVMFQFVGYAVPKIGLGVTGISTRMGVVMPILFSIIYYHEQLRILKVVGIALALMALFFIVYQKNNLKTKSKYLFFPLFLFLGSGIADTFVKYSQQEFVSDELLPFFSTMIFFVSLIVGLIINLFRKESLFRNLNKKILGWSLMLGVVNLGSIFFLLNALKNANIDSSIVFGINHLSIISLVVLSGIIFFKEKLTKTNWLGIAFAFLAIIILTYA
jgi:drug/metabolite transporter (DMT)-like permease